MQTHDQDFQKLFTSQEFETALNELERAYCINRNEVSAVLFQWCKLSASVLNDDEYNAFSLATSYRLIDEQVFGDDVVRLSTFDYGEPITPVIASYFYDTDKHHSDLLELAFTDFDQLDRDSTHDLMAVLAYLPFRIFNLPKAEEIRQACDCLESFQGFMLSLGRKYSALMLKAYGHHKHAEQEE